MRFARSCLARISGASASCGVLGEPRLDGSPVERLVPIPVVVGRRDEGGGDEVAGLEDRDRALERRERIVPVRVVGRKRQLPPERLPDDDVATGADGRLEGIERPGQASPDEARAEAEGDVVRTVGQDRLGGVRELERDAVGHALTSGTLDGDRMELGRELDPLHRASELLREEHARGRRARTRCPARVSPAPSQPAPEQEQLLGGGRVLELVIPLGHDVIAWNHRTILPCRG